ncbi:hypothetical protein EIK77_010379 [Talaromyces pinophilus]|nr:hypothetical protein EIK77_010379 [Talaromyces pinophilus]
MRAKQERKQANAQHTVEGRISSDMGMEAKTKRRRLHRGSRGIVVKACGMGSYADRPVAKGPGITHQSTVKGTGDKRTWKTLMKIRDKQRENRSKSAEKGRKQVLGRRGYLSHSTAYQYRSKLNSLCIIHPEWQHAKEDIDHGLLQRRINPKSGLRYGLHTGVADVEFRNGSWYGFSLID